MKEIIPGKFSTKFQTEYEFYKIMFLYAFEGVLFVPGIEMICPKPKFKGLRMVDAPEADRIARKFNFIYAEQLVKYLEATPFGILASGRETREDIKNIPLAIGYGYTVEEGNTFGDQVTFSKGNKKLWFCRKGWAVAEIIDGKFSNHRYYPYISDAITLE